MSTFLSNHHEDSNNSDEEDYLSDKFLDSSKGAGSTNNLLTYAEQRKAARRLAELRNVQNRRKSRHQLEEESRTEGLKQSLFERARKEEKERGTQNKAMSMMLKMGFQPGQSLGRLDDTMESILRAGPSTVTSEPMESPEKLNSIAEKQGIKASNVSHRTEPIAVDIWLGKKGIGLGKRAPSPNEIERATKLAKVSEAITHEGYRKRARHAYEEKRAEDRLMSATRTLMTLDEKAGVSFNILSLNPHDLDSLPKDLLEALQNSEFFDNKLASESRVQEQERLQRQMRRDALESLTPGSVDDDERDTTEPVNINTEFSNQTITAVIEFFYLDSAARLERVLAQLRQNYAYCFWCGTQYNDQDDMVANCPGADEEAHD